MALKVKLRLSSLFEGTETLIEDNENKINNA